MIKYVKGDLIQLAKDGHFTVIGHGCNCFNTMGAGIAKQIKENFIQVWEADKETVKGNRDKLGKYTGAFVFNAETLNGFWVLNLYTQYYYSWEATVIDFDAVRKCMTQLRQNFGPHHKIGLPKIGSDLAGGDWEIIEKIIEEELDGCDVTVVEYEKN